jgi:signal transduction histidine kinase
MDFTAVAHDLRTPLNAMLGPTRLLAIEGLSDPGRRRLAIIEAQIHRMERDTSRTRSDRTLVER